jgi:hypothetical protein
MSKFKKHPVLYSIAAFFVFAAHVNVASSQDALSRVTEAAIAKLKADPARPNRCDAVDAQIADHDPKDPYWITTISGTVVSLRVAPRHDHGVNSLVDYANKTAPLASMFGCTQIEVFDKKGRLFTTINVPPPAPAPDAARETPSDEKLEPVTDDNMDEILDFGIGFYERELAVMEHLKNWYEIDPDHPKAVALKQELCGNSDQSAKLVRHFVAAIGADPKDKQRNDAWINLLMTDPSLKGKYERWTELVPQTTSLLRQLRGMGFTCHQ